MFFWHVIIFFLPRDNKNISPWQYVLYNVQNKHLDVLRKAIKNKIMMHEK